MHKAKKKQTMNEELAARLGEVLFLGHQQVVLIRFRDKIRSYYKGHSTDPYIDYL